MIASDSKFPISYRIHLGNLKLNLNLMLACKRIVRPRHLLIISLFISLFSLDSCHRTSGDPVPQTPPGLTPEEQARVDLLSQTWSFDAKTSLVTLDGNDIGREFINFSLTVKNDFTYSTSGGSSTFTVWPSSGTWSFAKNADQTSDITRIVRSDGIEIKIESITSTDIVLSFQYTGGAIDMDPTQSGKFMSITGQYIFSLNN